MTLANRIAGVCLIALFAVAAASAQKQTNELTSNDIWSVSMRHDTLLILTGEGVNFTTEAARDTIAWDGFLDLQGWAIAYGGGKALIVLLPENADEQSNRLWLYDFATGNQKRITPRFPSNREFGEKDAKTLADFYLSDATWHAGSFWLACNDGGLLRLDDSGNDLTAFFPGIDKKAFAPRSIPPDENERYPDSALSVRSVAVDDSGGVWTLFDSRIMLFNPGDTTWRETTSLPEVKELLDVSAVGGGETTRLYITAATVEKGDIDTSLFRYLPASSEWTKALETTPLLTHIGAHIHAVIASVPENRLYIATDEGVGLYRDDGAGMLVEEIESGDFQQRMLAAYDLDQADMSIQDIDFAATEEDTFFVIATSQGLFYSTDERRDEREKNEFRYLFRAVSIASGLNQVYSYPSIINDITQKAFFAYNLTENARVTIDIYDYNMDHVIRIIDKSPRRAGSNLPRGRSTEEGADYWDGTFNNNGGKTVAPGPYYFKISTDKGQRAFGKVIVAKPR